MEGQHFCGVTDENEGEVVFFGCCKRNICHCLVLLQFVPIVPFKLQKMSETMYLDGKEEAMTKFCELLSYLPPEMVRYQTWESVDNFSRMLFSDK